MPTLLLITLNMVSSDTSSLLSETGRPRRGKSKFSSYLDMINPDSSEHQEKNELKQTSSTKKSSTSKSVTKARKSSPKKNSVDKSKTLKNKNKNIADDEEEEEEDVEYQSEGEEEDNDSEYEDNTPYCYCQKPDDGNFMIECHSCSDWFHGKCVNITEKEGKSIDKFLCKNCDPNWSKDKFKSSKPTVNTNVNTNTISNVNTPSKPSITHTKRSNSIQAKESLFSALERKLEGKPVKAFNKTVQKKAPLSKYNSNNLSSIRINARKGLSEVFTKIIDYVKKDPDSYPGVDTSKENIFWNLEPNEAGLKLETEMFDQLAEVAPGSASKACGEKYKVKYRQLRFNFTDEKNTNLRLRLIKGDISISGLVSMTAEELANEEVAQKLEEIRRQSLLNVLKGDYAKEQLEKKEKGEITEKELLSELNTKSAQEDKKRKLEEEEDIEAKTKKLFMKESAISPVIPVSSPKLTSPLSPTSTVVSKDTYSAPPLPEDDMIQYNPSDSEESMPENYFESEPLTEEEDNESETNKDDEKPVVSEIKKEFEVEDTVNGLELWDGTIFMHGFGTYDSKFISLNVTPQNLEWPKIFGSGPIEIAGRVNPISVEGYIKECRRSNTNISFFKVIIENCDSLWDYFVSKHRMAVIPMKNIPGLIRDGYLMPSQEGIKHFIKTDNEYIDSNIEKTKERAWIAILVFDKLPDFTAEKIEYKPYVPNIIPSDSINTNTSFIPYDESEQEMKDELEPFNYEDTSDNNNLNSNQSKNNEPVPSATSLLDVIGNAGAQSTSQSLFSKPSQSNLSNLNMSSGINTLQPLIDRLSNNSNGSNSTNSTQNNNNLTGILNQLSSLTSGAFPVSQQQAAQIPQIPQLAQLSNILSPQQLQQSNTMSSNILTTLQNLQNLGASMNPNNNTNNSNNTNNNNNNNDQISSLLNIIGQQSTQPMLQVSSSMSQPNTNYDSLFAALGNNTSSSNDSNQSGMQFNQYNSTGNNRNRSYNTNYNNNSNNSTGTNNNNNMGRSNRNNNNNNNSNNNKNRRKY